MPCRFWARIVTAAAALSFLLPLALARTVSLNGEWRFIADPARVLNTDTAPKQTGARIAHVPGSWQAEFADLRDYAGVAWYWRTVQVDRLREDEVALLHFGAVDYLAEVFVNGRKAGAHEGGYLPFELDVTSLLNPGENQIVLRVADPGDNPGTVEGIAFSQIPHGKQDWYVQTSGPWQDVELRFLPRVHLGVVHVTGGADGRLRISVAVGGLREGSTTAAELAILDPAGAAVWQQRSAAGGDSEFTGAIQNAKLWSPSSPALYTVRVQLASGDQQTYRFGFRTFEARAGKFYLNGQPIYLRGALDQDFYPDTVYTSPSLNYLRDEMRKAKDLGLNMLRCHIKAPDPRYLDAADEIGIIVWYEIPNWDTLGDVAKRRALETMRGAVERDWNHPSIMIFSVINESWGADLRLPADRHWLIDAWQQTKATVPGWLVVDNSACCGNFHLVTDIADFHEYDAIPDNAASFDQRVKAQAERASWLFSPYGDAKPRGDEPLVLSEFGNWGLPRLPQNKPWWFSRDFRGNPITLPDGVEQRFQQYGYASLFPDVNALAEATQWAEYRALKYEIETLRTFPQMQGYVITEFTDINWESNGLLSMWREPKVFTRDLANVQGDDVLVLRPERRNVRSGENLAISAYFCHYSSIPISGAELILTVPGTNLSGRAPVPETLVGSASKIADLNVTVPPVESARKILMEARIVTGGNTLVSNTTELFFYPSEVRTPAGSYAIYDPSGRLDPFKQVLQANGVKLTGLADTSAVWISTIFDHNVKERLRNGGRVLVLSPEQQRLTSTVEIVNRIGANNLDGNWISSFLWIRKDQPPFRGLGFNTLAGFETQMVTPKQVIRGLPPTAFNDVLSGIFYGWIHANVGALLQASVGSGRLLVCTYNLPAQYGKDPYATTLMNQLLEYAARDFHPKYELPLESEAHSSG